MPAVPQVAQPTPIDKENIEPLPEDDQEGCFKAVTDEDTDKFLRDNINKNTNYKTKSDMDIFTDWLRSNMEFRDVTDIPAIELDSLLARFYLRIYDLYDLFSLNDKIYVELSLPLKHERLENNSSIYCKKHVMRYKTNFPQISENFIKYTVQ